MTTTDTRFPIREAMTDALKTYCLRHNLPTDLPADDLALYLHDLPLGSASELIERARHLTVVSAFIGAWEALDTAEDDLGTFEALAVS
jgi:hypothetical protein